jgi:FtsP/CotA-like multicopper oxidase with cupredoxin domain
MPLCQITFGGKVVHADADHGGCSYWTHPHPHPHHAMTNRICEIIAVIECGYYSLSTY